MKKRKAHSAFTLVELLVVITIIILIAAVSLPSIVDFLDQRKIQATAQTIQMKCMEARSFAIAQRERHALIFFAQQPPAGQQETNFDVNQLFTVNPPSFNKFNNGSSILTGKQGSIYLLDTNENETPNGSDLEQIGQTENITEFTNFFRTGQEPPVNFALVFFPNGSMEIIGFNDSDNDPQTQDNTDIVINDQKNGVRAYLNLILNTSKVVFLVRNPNS